MGDSHGSSIALLLVVVGFALLWYFSVYDRPVTNSPSPNTETRHKVVVLGGSISDGVGAVKGLGYVDMLSEQLDVNITNLSTPYLRAVQAWSSVDRVTRLKPQIVIIELGIADNLIPETAPTTFNARLERIINAIHHSGSAIILIETPGFNHIHRNLAQRYQTALVSDPISPLLGKEKYMFNETSPNDHGHQEIAEAVKPLLLKLLREEEI